MTQVSVSVSWWDVVMSVHVVLDYQCQNAWLVLCCVLAELYTNNQGIRMATYTTVVLVTQITVLTVALTAAEWLVKPAADTKLHLVFTLVDN